jgi:hypothetical protein
MSNYITYTDKVGLIPKLVHVNQWWDDDANEVKTQHNLNDDRITVLEALTAAVPWANIQDIGDLSLLTPVAGDKILIERAGVKSYIDYSSISGGITDHSSLTNLDYASAGHTGFEKSLTFSTGLTRTTDTITTNDSEIDHNGLSNYDADRHLLESELEITVSQISDIETIQQVFEMTLPAATSVAGRVSGATLPSGWSLLASGVDLIVTHSLGRRVMDCKIWAVTGSEEQQLRDINSDNGLVTTDANTLKILSLATVNKVLKVYISFAL